MGNNSSRNDEEGALNEAQPVLHPRSKNTRAQNQPTQTDHHKITNTNSNYSHISSSNNNNINNKSGMKEVVKLPHNFEAIIQDCDSPIDKSSPEKLLEQLQAGVYLNDRKMKYWVKGDNINCFLLFAKGLQITWGRDLRYWVFLDMETREEGQITVAVLKNVCWLEVNGRFHTKNLTPGVKYEVAYLIMIEDMCYGWQAPVNVRLTLSNGTKQERKENLNQRPRKEWIWIPVGEFEAQSENPGEIEVSLYEYDNGNWKKGLIVKGIAIEPKI